MLRIHLTAEDLGRVRFAHAPAPVLETSLMLFELRSQAGPHAPEHRHTHDDWRTRVRTRFPDAARPLLNLLASSRDHVLILDVLTSGAEEAIHRSTNMTAEQRERDYAMMKRVMPGCTSTWLHRYHEHDPGVIEPLGGALRAFHQEHLAPYWSPITDRFDDDVDYRTAMMRDQGVAAMLEGLHPDLHLDGSVLYSPCPGDREADLGGRGLILMPSMFWTGRPLLSWDSQDPSSNVLIYPAKSAAATRRHDSTVGPTPTTPTRTPAPTPTPALAKLMGPTRAAILSRLRHPDTTSGVASALGISVSSASAHATALRDAGLIATRRTGKSVEHQLTPLGHSLLTHARST